MCVCVWCALTRYPLKLLLCNMGKSLQFPFQIVAVPVQPIVDHLLLSEVKGRTTGQALHLMESTTGISAVRQLGRHVIHHVVCSCGYIVGQNGNGSGTLPEPRGQQLTPHLLSRGLDQPQRVPEDGSGTRRSQRYGGRVARAIHVPEINYFSWLAHASPAFNPARGCCEILTVATRHRGPSRCYI